MDQLLRKQLKRYGLDPKQAPTQSAWADFLLRVDITYRQAEEGRYLLQRSMAISSEELEELNATLRSSQAHLADQRSRLLAMVEHLGDALCMTDELGRIVLTNPEAQRLLGYSAEELHLLPLSSLAPTEITESWSLDSCHRTEQALFLANHQQSVEVSYVLCPILRDNKPAGAVLIFRDVSELQRAREAALEAAHLKDQFLANMSHEIRTPMNAILGFAEMLRSEVCTTPQARAWIDSIQSNGEHLLHLLNDILDLSKIESGALECELVNTNLEALIRGVTERIRPLAQAKHLALEVTLAPSAPKRIRTDPQRLRQVLAYLLDNAVKFTNHGHVHLRLGCARATPDELFIEVEDTGIGMRASQLEAIFEPFRQVDASLTRRFGGTGLGLTLARE